MKELLIGSAEGKFLSAVTACNLHIAGHRAPLDSLQGLYSPLREFMQGFFCDEKS
jgi:hypothetical protein